ncbi:uncharacterized protein LOC117120543 [Anneissia japonica]|uniref:uncharacterized protein LOC117120543 n=1 Tax=Anneissia japonica TaxID=1529436 RepID=UPI0014255AA6|nr:uncharacterized protein LOC117120543 [Anneissia japonica]XP_033121456.1 uncharacterized protein LOC117120543 [Anneissia japonica]XP_033121457.1 uncharacterized protein LOC117120543 [Anneissia japonica]
MEENEELETDSELLPDPDGEDRHRQDIKKPRQSKAYVSAKILNDCEQRRLEFKLSYLEKEFRSKTNIISSEQTALKKELIFVNQGNKSDSGKGFIIPRGISKTEADKLKHNRRKNIPKPNLSLSLSEFDAKKKKTHAARETLLANNKKGDSEEGIEQRNCARFKKRRGAIQLDNRPSGFNRLARMTNDEGRPK